ncbi:winged helix-turn-helix transcriptional regulator [Mumia zhuanghuii]|uniref:Winged helix-turn-helix transcriptional regulator n=2 Tax=Mumia zhuanghuii TaxID=2585211 RepID=A0A5C4MS05_9ACTN|nr:winged helix-turn-helix transcriptional regulator [Mumia zhuanghuii]TNC47694.1 winged helix-turn-helix transcriptional regulator [Mumia zhuanghuii]
MITADPWHAMSDPTRRRVLARVAQGPCSVTDIASGLPVSRPAVSQHLRVLLDARLVDVQREGRVHLYRPRPEGLEAMRRELETFWNQTLANLKNVAEQSYQGARDSSEGEPTR